MILPNDKIIKNSIIQSSYNYFCECLEDFKEIQPDFEYTVNYGTNSNDDYVEDDDVFNFVVYNDAPELIPSHWANINGEQDILYAGYINLAVSCINPIPMNYTNSLSPSRTEGEQYIDRTYNQVDYNEISDDDNDKIEFGIRMLEAFSRFMRRKGIVIDNFNITSSCNCPAPDGVFDNGFYRLMTTLDITLKFNTLDGKLSSNLYSGENLKLWIKVLNRKPEEIYNVLDFHFKFATVDKTYPIFNEETLISESNQISRTCLLELPQINYGGNKVLTDLLETGTLEEINNTKIIFFDGYKMKQCDVVPTSIDIPYSQDKFNGISVSFAIKSNITDYEGDLNG